MRECHRNYAHGPMKLETQQVECTFRGETFVCARPVYICALCGFELHLSWMQDQVQRSLEAAYQARQG